MRIYLFLVGALLLGMFTFSIQSTYAACSPACSSSQVCAKKADGSGSVCLDKCTTGNTRECTGGTTCAISNGQPVCVNLDTGGSPTPVPESPTPTASATPLQDGLTAFGGEPSGLRTSGTLIGYVAQIIRWILGLLGMVFFVIIVLQGYLYMVAGGDTGKTAAATQAITNAVIGLMIIMGAFIITNFVTSALVA